MHRVMLFVAVLVMLVSAGAAGASGGDQVPLPSPRYAVPLVPRGEACNNPFPIFSLPYAHIGSTCGWRDDLQDYPACEGGPSLAPDVVFRYTPLTSQVVTIRVCNAGFSVRLAVLDNSRTVVACSDHTCPNDLGELTGAQLEGLEFNAGNAYYIVVDGANSGCGSYAISLELHDQALAVELTGFDAIPGDQRVTLRWSTASETDNDHFELSRDGLQVARINGNGNSSSAHQYEWVDQGVVNGTDYAYTLYAVDVQGAREQLAVDHATPFASAQVQEYALDQNYPNPFNPSTKIAFNLIEAGGVTLKIYNPIGREVATVLNRPLSEGRHEVVFNAANLPSGIYIYRLTAGNNFASQKKMILIK
jgi:hypothetical protein